MSENPNPRRVAYGFNRKVAEFKGVQYDDLWLDTDNTERAERFAALAILRGGDTLVLVGRGDLSSGRGLAKIRDFLVKEGIETEVYEPAVAEKKPRGRPLASDLAEKERARLGTLFLDPKTDNAYTITQACKAMGQDETDRKSRERVRQRLLRMFPAKK